MTARTRLGGDEHRLRIEPHLELDGTLEPVDARNHCVVEPREVVNRRNIGATLKGAVTGAEKPVIVDHVSQLEGDVERASRPTGQAVKVE
jgi:hypothetical protein